MLTVFQDYTLGCSKASGSHWPCNAANLRSIPGQTMTNFWWTMWHWNGSSLCAFAFSSHHSNSAPYSSFVHPPPMLNTLTKWQHQIKTSLSDNQYKKADHLNILMTFQTFPTTLLLLLFSQQLITFRCLVWFPIFKQTIFQCVCQWRTVCLLPLLAYTCMHTHTHKHEHSNPLFPAHMSSPTLTKNVRGNSRNSST